ncbi:MAG: fluoride efflux transporter CrcB [Bacteroidota bacterium]
MNVFLVFIGGGIGCVLRYLIGLLIQKTDLSLPVGTLIANVLACVIFALALELIQKNTGNPDPVKLLLLTGFCGGLSTFSTFGYESYLLIKQQQFMWFSLNVFINFSLCITAFFLIKK